MDTNTPGASKVRLKMNKEFGGILSPRLMKLQKKNEEKTNRFASIALAMFGLLFCLVAKVRIERMYCYGNMLFAYAMVFFGLLDIAFCPISKKIGYDKPYMKLMLLGLITLSGAVVFFFYPQGASFIKYGPIIISAMYYKPKLIKKTAFICFLLFSMILWTNVLLENTSEIFQELHVYQEAVLWKYPEAVLADFQIPGTIMYLITTFVCNTVSLNGLKIVRKQAEITDAALKMETELKTATEMQIASLPQQYFQATDGKLQIHAFMRPAKTVGGDFYDYFYARSKLVFLVADVSDKGFPAAMFMMKAKNAIRSTMQYEVDFEKAVVMANDMLCNDNQENMFVTMWIACLNPKTGAGQFINCGHLPPVIMHADGSMENLHSEANVPLGIFKQEKMRANWFQLSTNDTIFVYSDGLTDAMNRAGEHFGMQRLLQTIASAPEDIEDTGKYCIDRIDEFAKNEQQFDDMTTINVTLTNDVLCSEDTLFLPAVVGSVNKVIDMVNTLLSENFCPEDVRRNVDVALDEICGNIADYAYPNETGSFAVEVSVSAGELRLTVRDKGVPFDPLQALNPFFAEEPAIGGLGIYLTKNIMDEINYERTDDQNVLRMRKKW